MKPQAQGHTAASAVRVGCRALAGDPCVPLPDMVGKGGRLCPVWGGGSCVRPPSLRSKAQNLDTGLAKRVTLFWKATLWKVPEGREKLGRTWDKSKNSTRQMHPQGPYICPLHRPTCPWARLDRALLTPGRQAPLPHTPRQKSLSLSARAPQGMKQQLQGAAQPARTPGHGRRTPL